MQQVTITQPQDDQIMVNGKLVYRDVNNKWIASEELTVTESREFRRHLQSNSGCTRNIEEPCPDS